MDARLVWDMWRRILTDDALVARVLDPAGARADTGLSDAEIEILDDYAGTPIATGTNIGMYRDGLVRNALAAMSLVPLSQQLLYASGLDVDEVAADYAAFDGHGDHGPNFWRVAAGFVAYLAQRPNFTAPAHQDVLVLDAATIALARRLGQRADAWPDRVGPPAKSANARFIASSAATVVRSAHDLTAWIVNPETYDPAETLERSDHHWLVYFPAAAGDRGYAEISHRAARAFALLSTPMTAERLSAALGAIPLAEVIGILDALGVLGVVTALPDGMRPDRAMTRHGHVSR